MNFLKELAHSDKNEILVTQQKTLRIVIGILGMLLPLLLYIFLLLDTQYAQPLPSISHYYFTRVSSIFVIIVSALAVFLIIYKGKDTADFVFSTTAGLFALFLLLFPTSNIDGPQVPIKYVVTVLNQEGRFRPAFHLLSAGIFLLCLACMALFVFTRSNKSKQARGRQKRRRNRVYRTCGVMMILAVAFIAIGMQMEDFRQFYFGHNLTFWMEVIAVECFGIAWLVKAEVILKDKPVKAKVPRQDEPELV